MEQRIEDPRRESLSRALVALCRYSVEMTEIAHQSLGHETTENRDIEMVLTLNRRGPLTPTELAEVTGAPRSSVSRALNRLEAAGLTVRRPDSRDGRSVLIVVTPKGRRRVAAFVGRLDFYYASGEPLLKEAFDLLDVPLPRTDASGPVDPLAATTEVTSAGAAFARDASGPAGTIRFRGVPGPIHHRAAPPVRNPAPDADRRRAAPDPQRDLRAAHPPRASGPDHPPARPHPRRPAGRGGRADPARPGGSGPAAGHLRAPFRGADASPIPHMGRVLSPRSRPSGATALPTDSPGRWCRRTPPSA